MIVLKFGGTSVMNSERIKTVADIIKKRSEKDTIAVVSSALKGTTDLLIQCATQAESGSEYLSSYAEIEEKHIAAIDGLFGHASPQKTEISNEIMNFLDEIKGILRGIELVRECSLQSLDLIQSFGERMSCRIIASYLRDIGMHACYYDSRDFVVTDNQFGSAEVLFPETNEKIRSTILDFSSIPVITGFIGSTMEGKTTTIGRNGSDYSASIIAAALHADVIEIWTDVDGVYSADPRIVNNAFVISELNIQEATELSFFGAEVIHPYTMIPALDNNIPIYIKNTHNPSAPGTKIARNVTKTKHSVTGIASISNVASINIEGNGMLGRPGFASKVFDALGKAKINIIMISQASSEHSICLVCRESEVKAANNSLNHYLSHELSTHQVNKIDITNGLSIVAVIGENMKGTPGISGKLFNALGEANINILAIAQGSSERNISFVINQKDMNNSLAVIHSAFLS